MLNKSNIFVVGIFAFFMTFAGAAKSVDELHKDWMFMTLGHRSTESSAETLDPFSLCTVPAVKDPEGIIVKRQKYLKQFITSCEKIEKSSALDQDDKNFIAMLLWGNNITWNTTTGGVTVIDGRGVDVSKLQTCLNKPKMLRLIEEQRNTLKIKESEKRIIDPITAKIPADLRSKEALDALTSKLEKKDPECIDLIYANPNRISGLIGAIYSMNVTFSRDFVRLDFSNEAFNSFTRFLVALDQQLNDLSETFFTQIIAQSINETCKNPKITTQQKALLEAIKSNPQAVKDLRSAFIKDLKNPLEENCSKEWEKILPHKDWMRAEESSKWHWIGYTVVPASNPVAEILRLHAFIQNSSIIKNYKSWKEQQDIQTRAQQARAQKEQAKARMRGG